MAVNSLMELPNEVLIQILTPFTTHALLQSALVCTRFHNLVLRIIHHRLALAASLQDHKIIFECFHPGHKNIDPYLFCEYLGTPGLSSAENDRKDPVYFEHDGKTGFGRLGSMYSWFRPVAPEEMARLRRPHPNSATGALLQHNNADAPQPWGAGRVLANEPPKPDEGRDDKQITFASYPVNLDHDEGFTQLTMVTNLVKIGPRRGLFEQIVSVSDHTTRLKRDWMKNVAASTLNIDSGAENEEEKQLRTMWVDDTQNIGLRVRMQEKSVQRQHQPLLYREEEPAVRYNMDYEVLLIRTTRLLLAVEEALQQDHDSMSHSSLKLPSGDDTSIWDLAENAVDDDEPPITVEERLTRLARLLMQRDGLVRGETWINNLGQL